MSAPQYLFLINVILLFPIGIVTMARPSLTDQGAFPESAGWRMLVGSLWITILAGSFLGLWWPSSFLWILVFQVIYKSIWLLTYVMPRFTDARRVQIPAGITTTFAIIVLTWPWFIPWRQMFAALLASH